MSKKVSENEFKKKCAAQLDILRQQVVGESPATGKDHFVVFPIEAAVGKTYMMIQALVELYGQSRSAKTLVITLYSEEARKIAAEINNRAKNQLGISKNIAIAIDSQNKKSAMKRIDRRNIIVITHERYRMMCESDGYAQWLRMRLSMGIHNLIIDEEAALLVSWTVSANELLVLSRVLKPYDYPDFDVFLKNAHEMYIEMKTVKKSLTGQKRMKFSKIRIPYGDRKIMKKILRKAAKISIEEEQEFIFGKDKIKLDQDKFESIIENLDNILSHDTWIVDSGGISSYNDDISFVMKENNIILDASARMNAIYKRNRLFKLIKVRRITDHSKWEVCRWDENTSWSHKKLNFDFYERVGKFIAEHITPADRALIIGKKGLDLSGDEGVIREILDRYHISSKNYRFTNFKAMRGRNKWRLANKCFIIATPYEPFRNYAFLYLLYNKNSRLKDNDLLLGWVDGHYGFVNNKKLDAIKEDSVASSIYQGIKRINRGRERIENPAYVLLVNSHDDICKKVEDQLLHVKRKKIKPSGHYPEKRRYPKRPCQYAENYLKILHAEVSNPNRNSNTLDKQDVIKELGCSNFSRDVLGKAEVKAYHKEHHITVTDKQIIMP